MSKTLHKSWQKAWQSYMCLNGDNVRFNQRSATSDIPLLLESEINSKMEAWREIRSFPGYSVSTLGRVRNDETGRFMTLLQNQHDVVNVGLTQNRVQYKRAVALLVATAFLRPELNEAFDTPINLDGDRTNNCIDNLMWRPRWFVVKYHNQFQYVPRKVIGPIEEMDTGEQFENTWAAVTKYGLLDREILIAMLSYTYVWPTYQRFRKCKTDTH